MNRVFNYESFDKGFWIHIFVVFGIGFMVAKDAAGSFIQVTFKVHNILLTIQLGVN